MELRDLFTINEPVSAPRQQTYNLGGKVHDSVVMMQVNNTRFGSAAQFGNKPVDSEWNRWSFPVSIIDQKTFNVSCAIKGTRNVTFVNTDSVYNYSDTDIQIGLSESVSGELEYAQRLYGSGELDIAELTCISNELSLSSVSGEYSKLGSWKDVEYLNDTQFSLRGWKENRGPFGYDNASVVVTTHSDANTLLNHQMHINNSASNDYMQDLVSEGYVTGDRIWTHLFRTEFNLGEDYISTTDLNLTITYEGAVDVFLNGESIYEDGMKCGTDFPWGFSEYATQYNTTTITIDLDSYKDNIVQGKNVLAIALKVSGKNEDSAYVSAQLYGEIESYLWSDEKQVNIEISDGLQTEVKNFNRLDNFGLLVDIERLPAEHNADYKERMLRALDPNLPSNSTLLGLLNGISHQLGLPIDTTAIQIESNTSSESPNSRILTGITVYSKDSYFYFTADQFVISNEKLSIDSNYPKATTSETVDRIIKITDAYNNQVEVSLYRLSYDGTEIEINKNISDKELYITYQYAKRKDMSNSSIQDIIMFLNDICFGSKKAVTATLSEEFFPEVYRGTGSTSGSYFEDNISLSSFEFPTPLYLNIVSSGDIREVSNIDDKKIYYNGSSLSSYTDEIYTLNYCPTAFFIPRTRFEESSTNTLNIPMYHVRLDRIDSRTLEKYSNVYEGSISDSVELIKIIRDSMHVTWDEQVFDFDLWDAVDNFLMSNSEIPALYDMPKQTFSTVTNSMMSPDEFRTGNHASNDYTENFFTSNDFRSGVGGIYDDGPILHRDDLRVVDVVDVSGEWRPKIKTGFFYIRDREYYLFDTKKTRWLNDITWIRIPVPYVTANNGESVQPKVESVSITHVPTGYNIPSDYVKIQGDEIHLNMSFLNPEVSPGYEYDPFDCSVELVYSYYDLVGQSMSLTSSPSSTIELSSMSNEYVLDPTPTAGAPIVLTNLNAEPSEDYMDRHPQFSVTDGVLEFLDDKIDHQNIIVEWETGSGEYYISDDVDFNPANNSESTGFLAIENSQSTHIGESFDGRGGIL